MLKKALRGYKEVLGLNHTSTLEIFNNLGNIYADQGKLDKAEQIYEKVLQGYKEVFGLNHASTLNTFNNLGTLYAEQGKLGEAEQMYERALRGYEVLDGVRVQQYLPALNTLENMGDLYAKQTEIAKARAMYARALSGLTSVFGQSNERCMTLAAEIDALPLPNQEQGAQSKMPTAGEGFARPHKRRQKSLRLPTRKRTKKAF
jgi:tetratricopeptide (TPR) repeat protein